MIAKPAKRQIARENKGIVETNRRHCPNSGAYMRLSDCRSKGITAGQLIELICAYTYRRDVISSLVLAAFARISVLIDIIRAVQPCLMPQKHRFWACHPARGYQFLDTRKKVEYLGSNVRALQGNATTEE